MDRTELVTVEAIQFRVVHLRGQKVILDADLAKLYQLKTKVLNQAVKRNFEKFPEDFMFQLNQAEMKMLGSGNRSQIVTGLQKGFQDLRLKIIKNLFKFDWNFSLKALRNNG